ncbi:zinc-ribbon domain-containing protein [candidate division WWE3 bacterium]|nr:zinc-ribbon domain-containing protein [candidate division WWE3 bacterium]MBT7350363.1 zinc-ribbon domain-containing protein [candidate division WWE3 bacterium]
MGVLKFFTLGQLQAVCLKVVIAFCSNCGAPITDDDDACPSCKTPT